MHRNLENHPESRLSIRANPDQKHVIARAASARNMNVSQFVLQATLKEAEQVIRDESHLVVSVEEYDRLAKFMDEATEIPRLKAALRKKAVWDE